MKRSEVPVAAALFSTICLPVISGLSRTAAPANEKREGAKDANTRNEGCGDVRSVVTGVVKVLPRVSVRLGAATETPVGVAAPAAPTEPTPAFGIATVPWNVWEKQGDAAKNAASHSREITALGYLGARAGG